MNRTLAFGIAIFLSVVGISLVGGENSAEAGWGCCRPARARCCRPVRHRCAGGLFARCHQRGGCHGIARGHGCCQPVTTCCAPVQACGACGGHGCGDACGGVPVYNGGGEGGDAGEGGEGTPPPAPAPEPAKEASFTKVAFVR